MLFSVTLCLVTCFTQLCNTHSVEELNQYECGSHGRFEYCLNGIAGCVVGCHCHPGYYFDTETKICERNTKLTRDFRLRYMTTPRVSARNALLNNRIPIFKTNPTRTPSDILSPWNDDNEKDNDNLGDWLYNQFFKTIETQVINNTNEERPTRRSGRVKSRVGGRKDNEDLGAVKRQAQRLWKSKGKKRKTNVHGLRRKLLRITEDDSLFDSDENSTDSDDSDSDNDDSKSDSSHDETSNEMENKKKGEDAKDDKQHGHKKVIIFNRRPRPPLPSFIFLPNMETPYYPPIGLPPPPIVPMYPMVPVPPMAPFIPFIEHSSNNSTTTTAVASQPSSTAEGATKATTEATTIKTEENSETNTDEPKPVLRQLKFHKARKVTMSPITEKSSEETFMIRSREGSTRKPTSKLASRLKLMHKFRERLKKKKKIPSVTENIIEDEDNDAVVDELPVEENTSIYKPVQDLTQKSTDKSVKDRSYKYLSELIHKLNSTNDIPFDKPFNLKEDMKQFEKLQNTRRNYDPHSAILKCQNEISASTNPGSTQSEDVYFTNLGRQIACIVRNADSKIDTHILEEHKNLHKDLYSLINQYSYAPRSFWERSIRSPLTRFKNYIGKLDKHSSEKNLLNLENEVSYIASTIPPLSLQDLENILSSLPKIQDVEKINKKSTDLSGTSYNVDLLSNKSLKPEIYNKIFGDSLDDAFIPQLKQVMNLTNINQDLPNSNFDYYLDPRNMDSHLIDEWPLSYEQNKKIPNQLTTLNKTSVYENVHSKLRPRYTNVNKLEEHSKLNKLTSYIDRRGEKKPALQPKYQQVRKATYDIPIKLPELLTKFPEHPENFQVSSKHSEAPTDHHVLPAKYSKQIARYPVKIVKYPEIFANQSELLAKYPQILAKHLEVVTKYPEMLAKYPEQLTNNLDGLSKQLEVLAKYPEMLAKYPEVITKNLDKLANRPELFAKYPEILAKYLEILAKHPEVLTKYPEIHAQKTKIFMNYPDTLAKYPDMLVKYPIMIPKTPNISLKSPEIIENYPSPGNYQAKLPNQPINYVDLSKTDQIVMVTSNRPHKHPHVYRNAKFPTIVNFKTLNYYTEANNNHQYIFEANPLAEQKRDQFARRYEAPQPSSYFHHELHNFDYFD